MSSMRDFLTFSLDIVALSSENGCSVYNLMKILRSNQVTVDIYIERFVFKNLLLHKDIMVKSKVHSAKEIGSMQYDIINKKDVILSLPESYTYDALNIGSNQREYFKKLLPFLVRIGQTRQEGISFKDINPEKGSKKFNHYYLDKMLTANLCEKKFGEADSHYSQVYIKRFAPKLNLSDRFSELKQSVQSKLSLLEGRQASSSVIQKWLSLNDKDLITFVKYIKSKGPFTIIDDNKGSFIFKDESFQLEVHPELKLAQGPLAEISLLNLIYRKAKLLGTEGFTGRGLCDHLQEDIRRLVKKIEQSFLKKQIMINKKEQVGRQQAMRFLLPEFAEQSTQSRKHEFLDIVKKERENDILRKIDIEICMSLGAIYEMLIEQDKLRDRKHVLSRKTVTKLANDMATKGLIQFKNSLVIKNGIAMDHERVYGVVQESAVDKKEKIKPNKRKLTVVVDSESDSEILIRPTRKKKRENIPFVKKIIKVDEEEEDGSIKIAGVRKIVSDNKIIYEDKVVNGYYKLIEAAKYTLDSSVNQLKDISASCENINSTFANLCLVLQAMQSGQPLSDETNHFFHNLRGDNEDDFIENFPFQVSEAKDLLVAVLREKCRVVRERHVPDQFSRFFPEPLSSYAHNVQKHNILINEEDNVSPFYKILPVIHGLDNLAQIRLSLTEVQNDDDDTLQKKIKKLLGVSKISNLCNNVTREREHAFIFKHLLQEPYAISSPPTSLEIAALSRLAQNFNDSEMREKNKTQSIECFDPALISRSLLYLHQIGWIHESSLVRGKSTDPLSMSKCMWSKWYTKAEYDLSEGHGVESLKSLNNFGSSIEKEVLKSSWTCEVNSRKSRGSLEGILHSLVNGKVQLEPEVDPNSFNFEEAIRVEKNRDEKSAEKEKGFGVGVSAHIDMIPPFNEVPASKKMLGNLSAGRYEPEAGVRIERCDLHSSLVAPFAKNFNPYKTHRTTNNLNVVNSVNDASMYEKVKISISESGLNGISSFRISENLKINKADVETVLTSLVEEEHVIKVDGYDTFNYVSSNEKSQKCYFVGCDSYSYPWMRVDGSVNKRKYSNLLTGLVSRIIKHPGITETVLLRSVPLYSFIQLRELLDQLEEDRACFSRIYKSQSQTSLWSKGGADGSNSVLKPLEMDIKEAREQITEGKADFNICYFSTPLSKSIVYKKYLMEEDEEEEDGDDEEEEEQ